MTQARVSPKLLQVSGALLVALAVSEGFVGVAEPPVPGDVPTFGYGTTTHADGSPVRRGERIDPVRALGRLLDDANVHATAVVRCAGAPLYQHEFDAYTQLTYNIGTAGFCRSSIPKKLAAGDYVAACATILEYVCGPAAEHERVTTPGERCYRAPHQAPKKVLPGLENRRSKEFRQCMGVTHG